MKAVSEIAIVSALGVLAFIIGMSFEATRLLDKYNKQFCAPACLGGKPSAELADDKPFACFCTRSTPWQPEGSRP